MGKSGQTIVGDVTRDYCLQYPDIPDLTLARILYREQPKVFSSIAQARDSVRWHRGNRKGKNRNGAKTPIKSTAEKSRIAHQYRAPKSQAEPLTDFVIHGPQRILRLADIHYPFHDADALQAAVEYGMRHDPTIILLDGDIIDCHDLSDYEKDPRKRYTSDELALIAAEIRQLRKVFPKARIIWKSGNHEDRLNRYLMRRAPDLYGLPGMDVPGLVCMVGGTDAMQGVEWVDKRRVIRAGHLAFLHGHEFGRGGGGVNPARWLFLKAGENAICGHFHRTSEHSEPSLNREQRGAWSTGCLCDLTPDYMPHNKWNHGFAWVDVDTDGSFRVKNIRIVNGHVR